MYNERDSFFLLSRIAMKILLLQARNPDDPMEKHEVDCFVRQMEIDPSKVIPKSLLEDIPSTRTLQKFDALMVGGSGEYYVSRENMPGFLDFLDFLREVVEQGFPCFASCYGYQCLIKALGGDVVEDVDNSEVGTYELSLTEAGSQDPLFRQLGPTFHAQMGHKDRALEQPDRIPNLVESHRSPFQALRIPGKPIWATQFHPELTQGTNLDRFKHYLEGYSGHMDELEVKETFQRFKESPGASSLLRRFLDLVFES